MTGSLRTTNSWASAQDFASLIRANYIYEARASGFDVNAIFGARSPFPWENEISVPNLISPSDIRGHGCRADGFLTRGTCLDKGTGCIAGCPGRQAHGRAGAVRRW